MPSQLEFIDLLNPAAAILALLLSFILSTLIIRRGIPLLDDGEVETKSVSGAHPDLHGFRLPESASDDTFEWRSTGFWIGFCETFLIFVLTYADAFNALAIIIGAKQFVRREKISERPS